mgnify:CR=1 FL=1
MKTREILLHLINFLDENDKLNLRQVDKETCETLRTHQRIPYQTTVDFLLAISGLFYKNPSDFYSGWVKYRQVIASPIKNPAILYKLTDPKLARYAFPMCIKEDGLNPLQSGRVYDPSPYKHKFSLNFAWLLANIHLQRDFLIISDLTIEAMKRTSGSTPSAFSRELASVIKAKYQLTVTLGEIRLTASPSSILTPASQLVTDDQETKYIYKTIRKSIDEKTVRLKSEEKAKALQMKQAIRTKNFINIIQELKNDVQQYVDMINGSESIDEIRETFPDKGIHRHIPESKKLLQLLSDLDFPLEDIPTMLIQAGIELDLDTCARFKESLRQLRPSANKIAWVMDSIKSGFVHQLIDARDLRIEQLKANNLGSTF